jgi:hypothetical protein
MSTQLLALDGDAQHRHLRHTSNGSYGAAASVIAAGDMDRYTTLGTGTYDSRRRRRRWLLLLVR